MLTIEALRGLGADVEDGVRRCVNNEAFYLKMVEKAVADLDTAELRSALAEENLDRAFEICHGMKGVLANLSLTPALRPASEMTELLRKRIRTDYEPLTAELEKQLELLRALKEA